MAHTEPAGVAVANITSKLSSWTAGASSSSPSVRGNATVASNYIACVEQYVIWNATAPLAYVAWQQQAVVTFAAGVDVDAMVRVVLRRSDDQLVGRVILWDAAPVTSVDDAELIAAVAVDVLDQVYPGDTVYSIEVWHLRTTAYEIDAATARARQTAAAALIASI